jgi:hypothetical protein
MFDPELLIPATFDPWTFVHILIQVVRNIAQAGMKYNGDQYFKDQVLYNNNKRTPFLKLQQL